VSALQSTCIAACERHMQVDQVHSLKEVISQEPIVLTSLLWFCRVSQSACSYGHYTVAGMQLSISNAWGAVVLVSGDNE
jgi:hypothetical protein